jgi:hypothetical protein
MQELHVAEQGFMRIFVRALLIGLAAAVGAFAAIVAGLLGPADLKLTRNAYVWLAVGSILPGLVAFFLERRAVQDRLETQNSREQDRLEIQKSRERNERLLETLDKQIRRAGVDRGSTARALSRLGGAIMKIVCASDDDRSSDVTRFEQVLVQLLCLTLDKRLEGASPLRVMFLVHHGGPTRGQPEPQSTNDGLAPIIYHARSSAGFDDDPDYTIRKDSPDALFARRLMAQEPDLKHGFLIEDTTKLSTAECPLLPPDDKIMSYCRVAVRDPATQHGILCVDAWESGSLNKGDREVIGAFAAMLALGLTLGTSYQNRKDQRPPAPGSIVPSRENEAHSGR